MREAKHSKGPNRAQVTVGVASFLAAGLLAGSAFSLSAGYLGSGLSRAQAAEISAAPTESTAEPSEVAEWQTVEPTSSDETPSEAPTASPITATASPTEAPSETPSQEPTSSAEPTTVEPTTLEPTSVASPTDTPTAEPTSATPSKTVAPSVQPTQKHNGIATPSDSPTPSAQPTQTNNPIERPTNTPLRQSPVATSSASTSQAPVWSIDRDFSASPDSNPTDSVSHHQQSFAAVDLFDRQEQSNVPGTEEWVSSFLRSKPRTEVDNDGNAGIANAGQGAEKAQAAVTLGSRLRGDNIIAGNTPLLLFSLAAISGIITAVLIYRHNNYSSEERT